MSMGERWQFKNSANIADFVSHVRKKLDAGEYVAVEFIGGGKSDRQRGYQWGWFYAQACQALRDCGRTIPMEDGSHYPYDPIILHEILKTHVLRPLYRQWGRPESITAKGGKTLELPVSTEKDAKGKVISLGEFAEYIRQCRAWLWDRWEIAVPEPQDSFYSEFENEMRRSMGARRD